MSPAAGQAYNSGLTALTEQAKDNPARGPTELLAGLKLEAVRFADPEARHRLEPVLVHWAGRGDAGGVRLVKHNVSRSVYRCSPPGEAGALYFKQFHSRTLLHRLQRRLGFGDALCEMRFSECLSRIEVPAPRVLAACCSNGMEWLISECVEP